ncbi:hypothetical protein IVB38_36815 [Bradyrhizobium sp. 38]|jgi:hypothetical protein|uniref:hypothetical protein n=1 Tax=unclassified Bradyrhizobium TaxID=2631580 RepID=UPI001FF7B61E|nr:MULTISPECIES: hypothetical protein [unclassified Bradyrhizobium]MCK1341407.1 hypothetical protein [Bradyrhizobium sp. 38]MCK1782624.1 hypothetical protein [Bradyrhizobium sp. 132]
MLQLLSLEKKRELVRRADIDALIDGIAGVTLTALSSLPTRCAPRGNLAIRRSIERIVFEARTEIAAVCQQMAAKNGESPLDQRDVNDVAMASRGLHRAGRRRCRAVAELDRQPPARAPWLTATADRKVS